MHIRKRETISYTLKTVLMLDTSTSVRSHLEEIKAAGHRFSEKYDNATGDRLV